MVSVNNVQNTSNIRIRIFKGGLRLYDVVTELDKKIRRLFIMNLKKKLGLVVGALALTGSLGFNGVESLTSTDIARNDLPMEYSVKVDVARNDLPMEYSVKRDVARNDLPMEYSVKRDVARNDLPMEYLVKPLV